MNKRRIISATPTLIEAYEQWVIKETGKTVDMIVIRDRRGRFISWKRAEMYRKAFGIIFWEHRKYFNYVLYYYHHSPDVIEAKSDELEDIAMRDVEKILGYPASEWWHEFKVAESDIEPVKFNPDLLNTYETEVKEISREEAMRRLGMVK